MQRALTLISHVTVRSAASICTIGLIYVSLAQHIAFSAETAVLRPNILFCFADDWGRHASIFSKIENRPSPNQVVKTPNIDQVARHGVLFPNAFVSAPSCTPCRSALLSGQYFFRTGRGAILRGAVWDDSIPSFPLLLKDAGYHIGETYKVWSPGTPEDAPFGAGAFAYEKAGGKVNKFSRNATKMVADGMTFDAARNKLLSEVRGNFDAFLAARKSGQPFCYWFGPRNVHRAWKQGSGTALWGIDPDSLCGKLPAFLPDVDEVREDFADYLGEVQAFDAEVGTLLARLEETGELENTIVVLTGDHGPPGFPGGKCNLYDFGVNVTLVVRWPGGRGGRVVNDFVNLMDLAPTFLEVGGVKPPDVMTGRSLINVLESEQTGLVDPTRTWVVTGRERHVDVAREGNLPYPQRALRTSDFLYIRNFAPDRWPMGAPHAVTTNEAPSASELARNTRIAFSDMDASPTKAWLVAHRNDPDGKWYYDRSFAKRPSEELYDLRNDTDQVKNVADNPAFDKTKLAMSEQLLKILTEAKDPRVTGDGETFDRPPFAGNQ
ncbi:MAG: sulfatase [Pirellulales bacterium]